MNVLNTYLVRVQQTKKLWDIIIYVQKTRKINPLSKCITVIWRERQETRDEDILAVLKLFGSEIVEGAGAVDGVGDEEREEQVTIVLHYSSIRLELVGLLTNGHLPKISTLLMPFKMKGHCKTLSFFPVFQGLWSFWP